MAKREPRYEIFEGIEHREVAGSGWFYWRFKGGNGQIQAVGAEPFPSIGHARRAIRRFDMNTLGYVPVRIIK